MRHARGDGRRREVDDVKGLRDLPLVDSFVQAERGSIRVLHAGSDRLGLGARRGKPRADARGDSPPHGREPLPLRHLPEDRGGDSLLARLIRTEKEVEGRYTEQWGSWSRRATSSSGPPGLARRSAAPPTRVTGLARARGEARYTADVQLPGMLHRPSCDPHAAARVRRLDLAPALAAPGVRAALGRTTATPSPPSRDIRARPWPRSQRTRSRRRAPRSSSSTSSGRSSSRSSIPTRPCNAAP